MKAQSLAKLKAFIQPVKNRLLQKLLYGWYFIIGRNLTLTFISAPDPVVFSGNYFTLYWEVKGCYKIVINDGIVLPGTTTRVHFDSTQTRGPVKLDFYGYKNKITKEVHVMIIDAALQKKLALDSGPDQFKPVLNNIPITHFTVHKLNYSNALVPVIPVLSMKPMRVVATKTFLKTNFLPEPRIQLDAYMPAYLNPNT